MLTQNIAKQLTAKIKKIADQIKTAQKNGKGSKVADELLNRAYHLTNTALAVGFSTQTHQEINALYGVNDIRGLLRYADLAMDEPGQVGKDARKLYEQGYQFIIDTGKHAEPVNLKNALDATDFTLTNIQCGLKNWEKKRKRIYAKSGIVMPD